MDQLTKASQFQDCSSDSKEELVQCCKFPVKDRKERDNSTIIVFELSPYARKRNEEVDNTNLPLSRTEHHIPPSPIQNQENYEKSLKPHPKYLENKNQEASFLNSYEGTRSRP